jgi:hypothetical protein
MSRKLGELCRVREEQVATEQYAALETTIYNSAKQPLTLEDLGVAEPLNSWLARCLIRRLMYNLPYQCHFVICSDYFCDYQLITSICAASDAQVWPPG